MPIKRFNERKLTTHRSCQEIDYGTQCYIEFQENMKANGYKGKELYYACRYGHISALYYMFDHHDDHEDKLIKKINQTNVHGWTPLSLAVYGNHLKVCDILLKNGADVNALNANNSTSLHIACKVGNIEIAQFLINSGADVNISDVYGLTPLLYSKKIGNTQMVALLEMLSDGGAGSMQELNYAFQDMVL